MSPTARNHFISVSKDGRLVARRSGEPPLVVATSREGLVVPVPEGRMGVATIRVFFEHRRGAAARSICVTELDVAGARMTIEAFLARFDVTEVELGRWMREAVDRALDARA
jgi:hypothetical protein